MLSKQDIAAKILTLSPGEQKLAAAAALTLYGAANRKTNRQAELEANWDSWLHALFPEYFPFSFGDHHKTFWEWVWGIQLGVSSDPEVDVWPRGQGKSTNAEAACAA